MSQENTLQLFSAPDRRYKIIRMEPQLIVDAILNHVQVGDVVNSITIDGIPTGARIEAMGFDSMHNRAWMRVYHPSFDEVPENGLIPLLSIKVTRQELQLKRTNRGYEFI